MQPNKAKIVIHDNERLIDEMLRDLVIEPRIKLIEWSRRTRQTANVKIGYPGQHLASLVTGVEGSRTGARGHDLNDGSEVKSCSRIDQLDRCGSCKGAVSRFEDECPACGSTDIGRKNDSKWLFSIRSEADLMQLTNYDRVLLILADYPGFDDKDFDTLRFQAFEIWPKDPRFSAFTELMEWYYHHIYLVQLEERRSSGKGGSPAPKNFWPYSFQFYKCKPVKVFECLVKNAEDDPELSIEFLLGPDEDRSGQPVMEMPSALLNKNDVEFLQSAPDDYLDPCLIDPQDKARFRSLKTTKSAKKYLKKTLPERVTDEIPLREGNPAFHQKPWSRGPA